MLLPPGNWELELGSLCIVTMRALLVVPPADPVNFFLINELEREREISDARMKM